MAQRLNCNRVTRVAVKTRLSKAPGVRIVTFSQLAEFCLPYLRVLVSWPIVALVFLLAFRRQLVQLLGDLAARLTKAKFGEHVVEFSPRTVETDVGKTNVSAIATDFESDSQVFRSRRFGFEISFPANQDWILDSDPDDQYLQIPGQVLVLVLRSTCSIDGFHPNVNVVVQPTGDMTIRQYLALTLDGFSRVGGKLLSFDIDGETQGASLSYSGDFRFTDPETGNEFVWSSRHVARVVLANGFGYLATSSLLADSAFPDEVLDQMNSVLNSFGVTKR